MDPDKCPICLDGNVGAKWIRDFHVKDNIKLQDIAIHYRIDPSDVNDHIKNHQLVVKKTKVDGAERVEFSSPDQLLNEFATLYTTMRNLFLEIAHEMDENGIDSVRIDQLTKLSRECNAYLKTYAEITGRIRTEGDSNTKILQVQGDLNIITDILTGGWMCQSCEDKMMKKLDKVQGLLK